MASIDAFRAALIGGGARSNQFRVDLIFPGFAAGGVLAGQASQFFVYGAKIPDATIETIGVNYRGREVKLAGERKFQDWTVNVYNDTNFAIRNALVSWQDQINNIRDNGGLTAPSSYTTDMICTQLDRNGAELHRIKIVNAFPVTIGEINMDFGTADVEKFDVTFSYSYWQNDVTGNNT